MFALQPTKSISHTLLTGRGRGGLGGGGGGMGGGGVNTCSVRFSALLLQPVAATQILSQPTLARY